MPHGNFSNSFGQSIVYSISGRRRLQSWWRRLRWWRAQMIGIRGEIFTGVLRSICAVACTCSVCDVGFLAPSRLISTDLPSISRHLSEMMDRIAKGPEDVKKSIRAADELP